MTLAQIKKLLIGVLQKWFSNKNVLDKFTEDDGVLKYDGEELGGSAQLTDEQVDLIKKLGEDSNGKLTYNDEKIDTVCGTYTEDDIKNAVNDVLTELGIEVPADENEEEQPQG